jgi:hypothetical protein
MELDGLEPGRLAQTAEEGQLQNDGGCFLFMQAPAG